MKLDYDLVLEAVEGKKSAQGELFNRYLPFVYKHYAKYKRTIRFNTAPLEKEEFVNEAYLEFYNALHYVDVNKIYDKNAWKFLGVFGYYLSTLRNKLIRTALAQGKIESYVLDSTDEKESPVLEIANPIADVGVSCQSAQEAESISAETYQQFQSQLTADERYVLEKRKLTSEDGKPKAIAAIAADCGVSFSLIQHLNKSIEQKYRATLNLY